MVCLYKEQWFHINFGTRQFWNAVTRYHHTSQSLGSVLTSCYCIPQECLCVLHQICGTTVPFDLKCESVTYIYVRTFIASILKINMSLADLVERKTVTFQTKISHTLTLI